MTLQVVNTRKEKFNQIRTTKESIEPKRSN